MTLDDIKEKNQSLNNTLEAIKIETKKLETKKNELEEFKKEILELKENQHKEISKYSTFDADLIGPFISDLLTRIEKNNYEYITCTLKCAKYIGYDYVKRNKQYEKIDILTRIIAKDNYIPFLNSEISTNDFSNFFRENDSIIILDSNENNKLKNKINLYNLDLELNINAPISNNTSSNCFKMPKLDKKRYEAIKEYIDSIVDYRIQNSREDITSEELHDILIETTMSEKDLLFQKQFQKECEKAMKKILKKEKR